MKIAFIGAESSGKTIICKIMAEHYNGIYIPEFGRILGEITNNHYIYDDMAIIGQMQVYLEDRQEKTYNDKFIFCDTTPLITCFYSQKWYNKIDNELLLHKNRKYDLTFFCDNDFDYVDDGTRNGIDFGKEQKEYYLKNLNNFILLTGNIEERKAKIINILNNIINR